jgi:kynurenine formamidase
VDSPRETQDRITEQQFRLLRARLREQTPWGPDDRRGALNYLTPAETAAACATVRLGRSVSLAARVENDVAADNPEPADHNMKGSPDAGRGLSFAMDEIRMNVHGNADTHIDALCHVAFDGELYNGVEASDAITDDGATELSIALAAEGVVGRGVLLDVPRSRGLAWLDPGDHVSADDLLDAEREQDVRLRRGDIALVRVGHRLRRTQKGPWDAAEERVGLDPEAMVLLAERQVALLGNDGNSDSAPSRVDGVDFPVHVLAVNTLGMMLIDYLQLGELAGACADAGRWSFLCVIAPLRLPTATGSPVNPIAVL